MVVVIVLMVGLADVLLVGGGGVASVAVIWGAEPMGPEVVQALSSGGVGHQAVKMTSMINWSNQLKMKLI